MKAIRAAVASAPVLVPAPLLIPTRRLIPVLLAVASLGFTACAPARGGVEAARLTPGTFAPELGVDLPSMKRTARGLYVRTLRPGTGPVARRGQHVTVHYEGWLPDGTKLDSSRDRGEPLEIPLGTGRVIRGWDEGIAGMRVGELRRLVVPPELGYGSAGVPGAIPPNTPLLFEIELLGRR